ncbi:uncharacterized protein LOC127873718 isoform X2 [Dreissena polymorpha]|uniref:uncharacterized protein LOC127873718 isoform X2 n=1 Tax=Dreissena polymorpha TaxID=45954 RepID=UPI00226546E9|nr:uncharacterized protein LOC127873718 isoform X2 [Dreissena polymorpha]
MKRCMCAALCLQFAYVLSAPTQAPSTELESNNVEQELVNHFRSAADDTANNGHPAGDSKSSDESMDEDSWYDITVGDVIFDVLLTLRQHPEIVKELIASEKEKIAEQIDTYNNFRDKVVNPSEFEETAEQLNTAPKRVEKKAGREGMPVNSAELGGLENKSADDLTADGLTSEDSDARDTHESDEWRGVMGDITGGQDDPMFNYEKENNVLNYANQPNTDFGTSGYPFNTAFPFLKPGSTGDSFADDNGSDSDDTHPPHADDTPTSTAEDKTDEDDSAELHEHPLPLGPVRPYQDEDIVKM